MPSNEAIGPDQTATTPLSLPEVDVKSYPSEESLVADIIQGLEKSGACILRRLLDDAIVDRITSDMDPFLRERPECPFFAKEVTVLGGLVSKSEAFAIHVAGNPVWHGVLNHFLRHPYGPYWSGDKQYISYSMPLLGSSAGLRLSPGAQLQHLHRDDTAHRQWNKEATEYKVGRDTCLTSLTACTKTDRTNGATRVVPGSHLWDYARPLPQGDEGVVDVELNPGDSLIILGSVVHGHGANSTPSEERMVLGCGACCDYLRQEENQYLSHDLEALRRLPANVQRFIGYSTFEPAGGTAHWKDPWQILNPGKECQPIPTNTVEVEQTPKAVQE